MLFNSLAFLVFMPIVWSLYHLVRSASSRAYLLLAASYVFYCWWRVDFALLLVLSTLTDYLCGRSMEKYAGVTARRLALAISLVVNLSLLCAFKYWNFLAEAAGSLTQLISPGMEIPHFDVLLPIGISFYTFQTMGYSIDVYRREIAPERNLARFALYVSFFPQLVAGPIERSSRLLPQIAAARFVGTDGLVSGLRLMLWGMFKKVVVADRLAQYVDIVYADPSTHNGAQLSLATVMFAIQIYCDFSGYSDIAIGCARTIGFDLMKNFRRPYLASSPTDFWRRWHISLSTWFRDYVYIPLGGSRKGATRLVVALAMTFLLSGLWHGANWTFLAWGAVHAAMVLIERLARRLFPSLSVPRSAGAGARILGTVITMSCVTVAWVFFRAESMGDAWYILTHLLSGFARDGISCGLYQSYLLTSFALIAVVVGYDIWEECSLGTKGGSLLGALPTPLRWGGYWTLTACLVALGQWGGARQFIYFQF